MLLFIGLLIHEHLIYVSFQIVNVILHNGILVPHMGQEPFNIRVGPWIHGYGALVAVEVRVTTGR